MDPNKGIYDALAPVVTWSGFFVICLVMAIWLWRILRSMEQEESPQRVGCPACGYDMRATPRRCPECGFVPPPVMPPYVENGVPGMPVYQVPDDAESFTVVRSNDGGFAVTDERAAAADSDAAKLGLLFVPCRDEPQARDICDKLNNKEHEGWVQVDLLDPMPEEPA